MKITGSIPTRETIIPASRGAPDVTYWISARAKNAFIDITIDTTKYFDFHLGLYSTKAVELSQMITEMHTFATGVGLISVINTVKIPSGKTYPFSPRNDKLHTLCKSFSLGSVGNNRNINEVLDILLGDIALTFAFHDLSNCLSLGNIAIVNCARVLDTLKNATSLDDQLPDREKWGMMRNKLNIGEGYLKFITDLSKDYRHGKWKIIPPESDITEAVERTWVVMDRFFQYKLSSHRALTPPENPLLT